MPFSITSLISPRADRLPSRSPTCSRNQRQLYFPPGGHTHDRHSIPPDRLDVSLSDPVLVAAEQRLSIAQDWTKSSIIKALDAITAATPGSLSQRSGCLPTSPEAGRANPGHFCNPGLYETPVQDRRLLHSSDASCDIAEVMSMSFIDVSLDSADKSASENSRHGPNLAPLASEMFKEELYIRGYLERPASHVPQQSRTSLTCKLLPKVLGRRQGRKVAERLRTEQGTAKAPVGSSAHHPEKHLSSIASVTLRVPRVVGLESPGMDTTMSASESFDLHEFSYITAFTTPPASPSIVEMSQKVCLGDPIHAL